MFARTVSMSIAFLSDNVKELLKLLWTLTRLISPRIISFSSGSNIFLFRFGVLVKIYNFVFFSIFRVCLNSVTLSLCLSITLVRAGCYHNECICLMCSVGEVDSRLTCYNLSCCYVRKRWRVLFLCLICYVYCIYTPVTHECWTRKPRTVILVRR